jgi:hypothetical protein
MGIQCNKFVEYSCTVSAYYSTYVSTHPVSFRRPREIIYDPNGQLPPISFTLVWPIKFMTTSHTMARTILAKNVGADWYTWNGRTSPPTLAVSLGVCVVDLVYGEALLGGRSPLEAVLPPVAFISSETNCELKWVRT